MWASLIQYQDGTSPTKSTGGIVKRLRRKSLNTTTSSRLVSGSNSPMAERQCIASCSGRNLLSTSSYYLSFLTIDVVHRATPMRIRRSRGWGAKKTQERADDTAEPLGSYALWRNSVGLPKLAVCGRSPCNWRFELYTCCGKPMFTRSMSVHSGCKQRVKLCVVVHLGRQSDQSSVRWQSVIGHARMLSSDQLD